ncbi:hypothetical protein HU200_061802 [Digitaria exilis]|uniref:Protein kinase domain-containing protein n=1 Tax=Digitaria exilis TaxID=1010633 RepID=A0A835DW15_9POAL|nr:hypothetical protein HU200_061802 [Digitaria exilis]
MADVATAAVTPLGVTLLLLLPRRLDGDPCRLPVAVPLTSSSEMPRKPLRPRAFWYPISFVPVRPTLSRRGESTQQLPGAHAAHQPDLQAPAPPSRGLLLPPSLPPLPPPWIPPSLPLALATAIPESLSPLHFFSGTHRPTVSRPPFGGGRGRSPLSPLLGCLLLVVVSSLLSTVVRGAQLQQQQQLPELEVATYNYTSFQDGNSQEATDLVFSSNARIYVGAIQVTPDTGNAGSYESIMVNKSGSVLLRRAFTLWRHLDNVSNGTAPPVVQVVSFNTTFSVNVYQLTEAHPGEGLTFVVAPSLAEPPPGSYSGYLGLTNSTLESSSSGLNTTANKFVAIELDTFKQPYDLDDNHVGLDIGSVVSNKTASLAGVLDIATNATTATNYTVWVQYNGLARHISVFMAKQGSPKPSSPVLDSQSQLDLSEHVPEKAYLGFTASTGTSFELNCVLDWSLSIEIIPDKKSNTWIVIVAVAVPVSVVVVAIAAFFLAKKLRARRSMERRQERLGHQLSTLPGMPRCFEYEKLRKATKNFDERQQLGKGGYADDGRPEGTMEVAVKRFIRDDGREVSDFLAEVQIINRLRHKNIHLFRRGVHEHRPVLNWPSRYAIIADIAAGLHYVHHEYTHMVLHRDIKASNVLLDASFRARLGDFGLARVLDHDRNSFTDINVAGTRGFIAPEYFVGHKASRETDVFAFGALVLEVVTGQQALRVHDARCPLLVDWVWQMHGRGALLGAVDQGLGTDEFDHGEAGRLLMLALACSSPNPRDRPAMPVVLQVLSKASPAPEVPLFKPQFVWPPEGGTQFDLSDIGVSMSTSTAGSTVGDGGASTAMATQDTAHHSGEGYFPAISSGR